MHATYMKAALELAEKALNRGEFPVGCVMVYNGKIVAKGARKGTRLKRPSEIDHAEMIAIKNLLKTDVNPASVTAYVTMEPCLMCLAALILTGIKEIVFAYEDVMGGGTSCDLGSLAPLYSKSDLRVVPGVLREESLLLFKRFFIAGENDYWADSPLYRYTLSEQRLQTE